MSKGTPTVYAGVEFRSRLEARWAAFFDQLGVRWTYEPFDGNGYIPDFLLPAGTPEHAVRRVWLGQMIAEVISKLQRSSPIDPGDDYYQLFDDLVAMEAYRRSLLQEPPTPVLVEVKPAVSEVDYRAAIPKMTRGLDGHWKGNLLVVGVDPLPAWESHDGLTPFGLFGTKLDVGWHFEAAPLIPNTAELLHAAWAQACNATKWLP